MSDPTREMLEDARLQLDMLREALGVGVEPHQSLFERTMERARRMEESDREYAELADYLQSENPAASDAIRDLLDALEEVETEIETERCLSFRNQVAQLEDELAATRKQLAEAQADNTAMHSAAHRLALEAECFYMDCKDMALVSKWDDPLQTAISDVQSLRWSGDTKALDAAIAEAVEPYKLDAERYQQRLN